MALSCTCSPAPDRSGTKAPVDFDFNYTPVSDQYPASAPGRYVTSEGDTLRKVALTVWGDADLWYLIADANGLSGSEALPDGLSLIIPNRVSNVHNNSETFKPYNAAEIIGDVTPQPPAPPAKSCNPIAQILIVVVTIIVAIYAPYALGLTTYVEGTGFVATAAVAGSTTATAVTAGVVGGAAGSIAGQTVAVATDQQDSFSWRAVAQAGLTGGVTMGLSSPGSTAAFNSAFGGPTAGLVARTVLSAAAGQGINVALNDHTHFQWSAVAGAALTTGLLGRSGMGEMDTMLGLPNSGNILTDTFNNIVAGTLNRSVQIALDGHGKLNFANIAADAFGTALGNYIVGELKPMPSAAGLDREAEAQMRAEMAAEESERAAGTTGWLVPVSATVNAPDATQAAGDVPFYLNRNSANPGSLSITVTGGRVAASQAEFDAYIGNTGYAGASVGVNPPVDNTTLGSALRDTGRAVVNAGIDVVEGVPNLLSGALPGFPDYVPFMQNLRLPYDTPAFGVTLEVLSGFGAAKAFSLAAEGATVGEATNVFHATTSPRAADSILTKGIDPAFLNPDSRFGPAFYVAEAPETALAELAHHGAAPTTGIRFELNSDAARTLDLTVPEVAEAYGYRGGPISSETQAIGARALDEGFNAIKYNSLRGSGANYAVLDNFNGFYPDSTDTFEKADTGQKECSCRSEGSSVRSSSGVLLSRRASRASVALRSPGSWASGTAC